jgi:hypothetical protein
MEGRRTRGNGTEIDAPVAVILGVVVWQRVRALREGCQFSGLRQRRYRCFGGKGKTRTPYSPPPCSPAPVVAPTSQTYGANEKRVSIRSEAPKERRQREGEQSATNMEG